jgi:hypothetical protein
MPHRAQAMSPRYQVILSHCGNTPNRQANQHLCGSAAQEGLGTAIGFRYRLIGTSRINDHELAPA